MILVTGTSGFIGRHLLEALITRYGSDNILALTSKPVTKCRYVIHHNYAVAISSFDNEDLALIKTIIHAGAYTPKHGAQSNDWEKCTSNIHSVECLLKIDFPNLENFIFLSTLDVYGKEEIISETSLIDPVSLYGHSKLYGEHMVASWAVASKKVFQVLRVGHVYGPGEEAYQKLIPATLKRLALGQAIELWGQGNEIRSFIYVNDVVEAIVNAISLPASAGVINVAGEEPITVNELIQKMVSISGMKVHVEQKAATSKSRDLRFDVSKLKHYLLPNQTPLEQGLRAEWNYMKQLAE